MMTLQFIYLCMTIQRVAQLLFFANISNFHLAKNKKPRTTNRLEFSRFLDLRGNLGNVKEKPTRKTCFSRGKKRLATRNQLAKFC